MTPVMVATTSVRRNPALELLEPVDNQMNANRPRTRRIANHEEASGEKAGCNSSKGVWSNSSTCPPSPGRATETSMLVPTEACWEAKRSPSGENGILPVIGAGLVWSADKRFRNPMVWVLLITLYGLPPIGLAAATGWWPLAGIAVHLAMTARRARLWVAVEYGSSSFCLLLFVSFFDRFELFPWGLPVLIFQGGVLLLMALFARHLWVDESDPALAP